MQITDYSKLQAVDSKELVLGDILLLQAGNYIPADIRFLKAHRLTTNESALPLSHKSRTIYEASNMEFLGNFIVNGSAYALVIAIDAYVDFYLYCPFKFY